MGYEIKSAESGCTEKAGLLAANMGFGHWRAARGAAYGLTQAGLPIGVEIVNFTEHGSKALRKFWDLEDKGLAIMYRHSGLFNQIRAWGGDEGTATLMDAVPRFLDRNKLHKGLDGKYSVLIAGHATPSALLNKPHILLVCDPAPFLYLNYNPHAQFAVVDGETGERLRELRQKKGIATEYHVTGPMVAPEIVEARNRFPERKGELKNGAPLRIVIATGGSHTHSSEIVHLAEAYAEAVVGGAPIEHVSVVTGNGKHPDSVWMNNRMVELTHNLPPKYKNRIRFVTHPDSLTLVEMADKEIGNADVIHAKTGELVYVVAGGKAMETLNPAGLALQEYCLARYSHLKSKEDIHSTIADFLIEMGVDQDSGNFEEAKTLMETFLNRRYEAHFSAVSGTSVIHKKQFIALTARTLNKLSEKSITWNEVRLLERELARRLSALEVGRKDPRKEVEKILTQLDNQTLLRRMELGLGVPADGPYQLGMDIRMKLGMNEAYD